MRGPSRQFVSLVSLTLALSSLIALAPAVSAHGTPPGVEVQALIRSATDPLTINYQITTFFSDGDPAEATVTISAESGDGDLVEAIAETTIPGVAISEVVFPEAATWTVTVEAATEDGTTIVTFTENLPWPHYSTEAGIPKVKVDTVDPSRVGTLLTPSAAVPGETTFDNSEPDALDLDATPASEPETTESPTPTPATPPSVEVSRSLPTGPLRTDIALRLVHLMALGLWVVPVLVWLSGKRQPGVARLSMVGVVATLATGLALSIWGAPLDAPGLFRWTELGDRLFGGLYQWAFAAKLAATAIAVSATVAMARRRVTIGARIALSGVASAAVAVTVMTQAHLFTHL